MAPLGGNLQVSGRQGPAAQARSIWPSEGLFECRRHGVGLADVLHAESGGPGTKKTFFFTSAYWSGNSLYEISAV